MCVCVCVFQIFYLFIYLNRSITSLIVHVVITNVITGGQQQVSTQDTRAPELDHIHHAFCAALRFDAHVSLNFIVLIILIYLVLLI